MAFLLGRIPRFSPSFSPAEAWTATRYLLKSGPEAEIVHRFEGQFADYVGADHAVMVPSARYGFYLLLQALGLGEGDEVIFPAMTYFAIPAMAKVAGVTPVFADIGATTHVLDPESFEAAITPRTRAVVPTHLFGTPCDMDPILEIARRNDILVIEDTAQATGARYRGKRAGGIGDHAYFTFGLTKNITTLSGAMVTTDDPEVAASVRKVAEEASLLGRKKPAKEVVTGMAMWMATHPRVYPLTLHNLIHWGNKLGEDPIHDRFGEEERTYNEVPSHYALARPRAAQAAVGMRQLERIDTLNGARARNGRRLDEALANVPGLICPSYPAGAEPIYMSFVIHHRDRNGLAAALRTHGVDTTVGYMSNCADSALFPKESASCPNAEEAFSQLLHIPVHPNLDEEDVRHIAESIRRSCLEVDRSAS